MVIRYAATHNHIITSNQYSYNTESKTHILLPWLLLVLLLQEYEILSAISMNRVAGHTDIVCAGINFIAPNVACGHASRIFHIVAEAVRSGRTRHSRAAQNSQRMLVSLRTPRQAIKLFALSLMQFDL